MPEPTTPFVHPSRMRPRRLAVVLTIGAVLAPALMNRASFPLSTYPIYAHSRERHADIVVVRGVLPDGSMQTVGLEPIAGTDDPLIAQSTIDRAVRDQTVDDLCSAIAGRVGAHISAVEIAVEQHDLVSLAAGRSSLGDRRVLTRCEVSG